jgi:hypothetical protein
MFALQLVPRLYLQGAVQVSWLKSNYKRVKTAVQKGCLLLCTLLEAGFQCETKALEEVSHIRTESVLQGTVV